MVASGTVSLILAGLLIAFPAMSLLTLTWLIAFQAFLAGGLLLGTAFRLRLRSLERSSSDYSVAKRHEPEPEPHDARSSV